MNDRLTAMDVEKQEFAARVRGYDREEVRMFLRTVAEELGRLHLENGVLREEIGRLKESLDDLKARDRMLQETLVTAQGMAVDLRDRSNRDAEIVIKEARGKAERILEDAHGEVERIESETSRARLERDAFENRLRSCIEEHLALLDMRKSERAQGDNVHVLRRRSTSDAG